MLSNSPSIEHSPGKKVTILYGQYELGDMLGSGSFGHVYECTHVRTGRIYALKVYKTKYANRK